MNADFIKLKHFWLERTLGARYVDDNNDLINTAQTLPNSLENLQNSILNCTICSLSKNTQNRVIGDGSLKPKVMFIAYSYGALEEKNNKIFIGKSQKMIDDIVANVFKLTKNDVYLSTIFKCKLGANSIINDFEEQSCKPYILKQIEILKPKVIVALGEKSYNIIMNKKENLDNLRGHILKMADFPLIATYDVGFLLRNPSYKSKALDDFKMAKGVL